MGAFQRWLDGPGAACCPDPDPSDFDPELDAFEDAPETPARADDAAITAHGYDSRATPVDTLMAGPVSMGLRYAHDMTNPDEEPEQ